MLIEGELDPGLSRWMWLVKWFLAIPHVIVLAVLVVGGIGYPLTRIDWDALDQVERVGEFDPELPILLFHGTEDATVPVEISDAFEAFFCRSIFRPSQS